jgi:antitoxin HicB
MCRIMQDTSSHQKHQEAYLSKRDRQLTNSVHFSEEFAMRFTVVLFRDEETDSFEAVVPALPGCVTYGTSIEHALAMAQELAEIQVARMIEAGDEIPGETEASLVGTVEVRVPVPA